MAVLAAIVAIALILFVLADGFESILLPRRIGRRFRYARFFYRTTWGLWRRIALRLRPGRWRQAFLGVFGPLSLLVLFASWVGVLIFGFALLQCAVGGWPADMTLGPPGQPATAPSFGTYLYLSGVTFFTLGYGDVTPATVTARVLAVIEAGGGFGFLAIIIAYLPILYQAFSRREVMISLLDARAGSPPTAAAVLSRAGNCCERTDLDPWLADWERWAAELLESQVSFPVLGYYRSQHDNQSWLAALTTILDSCALLLAALDGERPYQAQLTFAMSRHAAVDLALVIRVAPVQPDSDRLSPERRERLWARLRSAGLTLRPAAEAETKLAELRSMYEPFVSALSAHFLLALPEMLAEGESVDNWQRSRWQPPAPGIGALPAARAGGMPSGDEHFG